MSCSESKENPDLGLKMMYVIRLLKNTVKYMLETLEWQLGVWYRVQCNGIMHSQFLRLFHNAKNYL